MAGVPLWRQQPAKVHVGGQTFQLQNRGILYSHKAAFDLALLTTLTSFPAALPIIYHAPVTLPFLLFLGTSQALSHLGFFFQHGILFPHVFPQMLSIHCLGFSSFLSPSPH